MNDSEAESNLLHNPRIRQMRYTSEEIRRLVEESDFEYEEEPYVESDEEHYVPKVDVSTAEESDIEHELIIEQADEYDSEESIEDKPVSQSFDDVWVAKERTIRKEPFP